MKYYKALLRFDLRETIKAEREDGAQPVVGYYQNFTIRAKDTMAMRRLCESHAASSDLKATIDWKGSEVVEIYPKTEIDALMAEADSVESILRKTGRVFFPET